MRLANLALVDLPSPRFELTKLTLHHIDHHETVKHCRHTSLQLTKVTLHHITMRLSNIAGTPPFN